MFVAFTFGHYIGRSCVVVEKVAKCCVSWVGFIPTAGFVVLNAIELECVPLAFLNRIGKSEDVGCSACDGFNVSIDFCLRVISVAARLNGDAACISYAEPELISEFRRSCALRSF